MDFLKTFVYLYIYRNRNFIYYECVNRIKQTTDSF